MFRFQIQVVLQSQESLFILCVLLFYIQLKLTNPLNVSYSVRNGNLKIIYVLAYFQVLEDPLQLKRLQCVIDGYVDEDCTTYEGMLGESIYS